MLREIRKREKNIGARSFTRYASREKFTRHHPASPRAREAPKRRSVAPAAPRREHRQSTCSRTPPTRFGETTGDSYFFSSTVVRAPTRTSRRAAEKSETKADTYESSSSPLPRCHGPTACSAAALTVEARERAQLRHSRATLVGASRATRNERARAFSRAHRRVATRRYSTTILAVSLRAETHARANRADSDVRHGDRRALRRLRRVAL